MLGRFVGSLARFVGYRPRLLLNIEAAMGPDVYLEVRLIEVDLISLPPG